eukprot:TRINITY_DN11062_c0_g1_i1.p1 TRINITY_DN11062_c0_g1~~TRINITY_DN11062_c0_g1_i1.p1  ORF type:complete len:338 (-),score=40.69 TRINITY_DN11062_c0_g1_i1:167-1180(-)
MEMSSMALRSNVQAIEARIALLEREAPEVRSCPEVRVNESSSYRGCFQGLARCLSRAQGAARSALLRDAPPTLSIQAGSAPPGSEAELAKALESLEARVARLECFGTCEGSRSQPGTVVAGADSDGLGPVSVAASSGVDYSPGSVASETRDAPACATDAGDERPSEAKSASACATDAAEDMRPPEAKSASACATDAGDERPPEAKSACLEAPARESKAEVDAEDPVAKAFPTSDEADRSDAGVGGLPSELLLGQATDATSSPSRRRRLGRAVSAPETPSPAKSDACCICLTLPRECAFTPCGHRCVCRSCGMAAVHADRRCPICRATAGRVLRIIDP